MRVSQDRQVLVGKAHPEMFRPVSIQRSARFHNHLVQPRSGTDEMPDGSDSRAARLVKRLQPGDRRGVVEDKVPLRVRLLGRGRRAPPKGQQIKVTRADYGNRKWCGQQWQPLASHRRHGGSFPSVRIMDRSHERGDGSGQGLRPVGGALRPIHKRTLALLPPATSIGAAMPNIP